MCCAVLTASMTQSLFGLSPEEIAGMQQVSEEVRAARRQQLNQQMQRFTNFEGYILLEVAEATQMPSVVEIRDIDDMKAYQQAVRSRQ